MPDYSHMDIHKLSKIQQHRKVSSIIYNKVLASYDEQDVCGVFNILLKASTELCNQSVEILNVSDIIHTSL